MRAMFASSNLSWSASRLGKMIRPTLAENVANMNYTGKWRQKTDSYFLATIGGAKTEPSVLDLLIVLFNIMQLHMKTEIAGGQLPYC